MLIKESPYYYKGKAFRVNTYGDTRYIETKILERGIDQLYAMLSHHSKVLAVRFDFHVRHYTEDNQFMTQLVKKLRRHLYNKYGMKRFGYLWAREQERVKKQHYHVVLFLNGHKINHPCRLLQWLSELSKRHAHDNLRPPKNCFYHVHRNDQMTIDLCVERFSYLAKERGKGYQGKGCNNYSASCIVFKPFCDLD